MEENHQYGLGITPFTLYEILSIKRGEKRKEALDYLIANGFEVLGYSKFPALRADQDHLSFEWLPHLRKLIVYECNRLLEGLALDYILSNVEIDFNPSNSDAIINELNDFRAFDENAGRAKDLKAWFDGEYFSMFFSQVSDNLVRNCGFHISAEELMTCCLSNSESLYGSYPISNMTTEDRFLSRYILKMSNSKQRKHKMINYVIDALNLHSVFQKGLDAYFVSRDLETINLFFDAERQGVFADKDKVEFLLAFLN